MDKGEYDEFENGIREDDALAHLRRNKVFTLPLLRLVFLAFIYKHGSPTLFLLCIFLYVAST